MKNKIATAVATTSLLAGIFGSTFVGRAYAAAGVIDWASTGCLAVSNAGTGGAFSGTGTASDPYIVSGAAAVSKFQVAVAAASCKDEFGAVVDGTVSISASGAMKLTAPATINTAGTSGSFVLTGTVNVQATESATTSYGSGSVSLSLGGVSKSYYFTVYGPIASMTFANDGLSSLAGGKAGQVDKLVLKAYDAAGTLLTAPADGDITFVTNTDGIAAAADVTTTTADDGKWGIANTACTAATSLTSKGDVGKSWQLRARVGAAGEYVYSNYVSVLCTDNGQFAVLKSAALDAKSYDISTNPKVVWTFEDGFGNLLGEGGVVDITGTAASMEITGTGYGGKLLDGTAAAASYAAADGTVAIATGLGKVSQTITSTATMLGKEWMVFKVADSNLGVADDQAASYTLRWSLIEPQPEDEATIVKSGYKVTADFGDFGAKKKISFVVENVATGVVVTYVRKANASGVASYTIGRKGSFEIYAMLGDEVTETVLVKR